MVKSKPIGQLATQDMIPIRTKIINTAPMIHKITLAAVMIPWYPNSTTINITLAVSSMKSTIMIPNKMAPDLDPVNLYGSVTAREVYSYLA